MHRYTHSQPISHYLVGDRVPEVHDPSAWAPCCQTLSPATASQQCDALCQLEMGRRTLVGGSFIGLRIPKVRNSILLHSLPDHRTGNVDIHCRLSFLDHRFAVGQTFGLVFLVLQPQGQLNMRA